MVIAILHIVGALLVTLGLGVPALMFQTRLSARDDQRLMEECAMALGVDIDSLGAESVLPKVTKLSAERYSSELLRNRLSDLCGAIRKLWGWVGLLAQAVTIVGVAWFTLTEDLNNAPFAWFLVGVWVFFWITDLVFTYACKILTGRFPGQARMARERLVDHLSTA